MALGLLPLMGPNALDRQAQPQTQEGVYKHHRQGKAAQIGMGRAQGIFAATKLGE